MVSLMLGGVFAQADLSRDKSGKGSDRVIVLENKDLNKGIKEIEDKKLKETDRKAREKKHLVRPYEVRVYLSPEKHIVSSGESATYKVIIKDNHPKIDCRAVDLAPGAICPSEYTYKIVFDSRKGVKGELEQERITLTAGEKKAVKLTVSSKKLGVNSFVVKVKGKDSEARAKGILFVSREPKPTEGMFFKGSGFAVNKGETDGMLIDLKILKTNGDLKGKITIFNSPFKLKGSLSRDGNVEFKFSNPQGDHYGKFSGKVKKFPTFKLLKGDLTFKGKTYKLTVFSKHRVYIKEVSSEDKRTTARIKDTIVLKKKLRDTIDSIDSSEDLEVSEEETYISPIKIKRKKFLGIFPYGKKLLELEIVKGDEVIKITIKEKQRKRIKGLDIEVGSLADEENIEITIEEVEEA